MSGDITEVAYESALRALDKQERVVEELRSRTGVLLAASSLAVTFLGRPLPANFAAVTVTFALGAFAATIGASVYILLPKSTFFFSVSGRAVLEELYDFRDDIAEIRRRLVYDMERFWYTNDRGHEAALPRLSDRCAWTRDRSRPTPFNSQRYSVLAMATPKPTPPPPPPPPPTPNIGLPETRGGKGGKRK